MGKKGLVFCHTCNKIVGNEFPVSHYHRNFGNNSGAIWMLDHKMLGFGFYADTPKMRKHLAKNFRPRNKITVSI